jgi:glutathione synthase/RimK-type ligase-like ATP-grasp enzyme
MGIEAAQVAWDDPLVNWKGFDACLIRTTWDYTQRPQEFLAWVNYVSTQCTLYNPAHLVEWNLHKSYLRDLERKGVEIVPTVWLERGTCVDLADLIGKVGWRRGFLKPAIGATARETLRFDVDTEGLQRAQRAVNRLLGEEDLLLQPYLERVEREGEISAIFVDGQLSHMVRKIPVAGDYRVQDDFGASDEPYSFSPKERELACAAVAAIGEAVLYARTDFLRDDDGAFRLTELEIVEPSLFFRHCAEAARRLAEALVAWEGKKQAAT